eukprot:1544417-Amphidinium_carterae.1
MPNQQQHNNRAAADPRPAIAYSNTLFIARTSCICGTTLSGGEILVYRHHVQLRMKSLATCHQPQPLTTMNHLM